MKSEKELDVAYNEWLEKCDDLPMREICFMAGYALGLSDAREWIECAKRLPEENTRVTCNMDKDFYSRIGSLGGSVASKAKARSSRANGRAGARFGKLGGRPRLPEAKLTASAMRSRRHRERKKSG